MIAINATIDKTGLKKAIDGLAAMGQAEGLTVQFVCWDVMRAWTLDMMTYTPPWANGKPGNTLAQRNAGRKAITYDLMGNSGARGILGSIDNKMQAWMDWNDKLPDQTLIKLKSGAIYLVDRNLYRPGAGFSEIYAHHLKYRNQNGRVTKAGQRDRKIGRWKSVDKFFTEKKTVRDYVKHVQARVGSLKAGWIPALNHWASLSRGSTGRLRGWILEQNREGSSGGMVDKSGNGSIYSLNSAHHSKAIRTSTANFVRDKQEKNMTRFAKYRIQRLCDQFNKGQNPTPDKRSAA